MIKHIVMWKIKSENKENNLNTMKEKLEALNGKIDVLRKIEVGINNNEANEYDIMLYSEFDSMDDLNVYQKHPEHVKVGAFVKEVAEKRSCVDYEI